MSGSSTKGKARRASAHFTTGPQAARSSGADAGSSRGATWGRGGFFAASLAFLVSGAVASCGGDDNQLNPPGGTTSGTATGGGTCSEGAQRDCHVTIGEHEGVLTCMAGVQRCEGGAWTTCGDGVISTKVRPRGDSPASATRAGALSDRPLGEAQNPTPRSISAPGPCVGNPCDPSCQNYDEVPPTVITPPAIVPPYPWDVGDINELPDSVLNLGTHEPCTTAEDCQFDQYCDSPARGACAHSLCAAGDGVNETCSACATKICDDGPTASPDADPTCCLETYAGACDHDPCTPSSALKASCDPCVAAICAARPMCCIPGCTSDADCPGPGSTCHMATQRCTCTTSSDCPTGAGTNACSSGKCVPFWGQGQCVNYISSICGKTCPAPNPWTQACADKVGTVCGAQCDTSPPCEHDKCYTGGGLTATCEGAGGCVEQICLADPTCCGAGGTWKQSCVDMVQSVCGETCAPKGNCVSWLPGTSDASCGAPDLTLGVPCGGTIPVCNRGSVAVGPGVEIASYPSGSIPSSAPNKVKDSCNPPPGTVACTTAAAIAPGECVSVSGCAGLTDGMELMINPPGAAHVNECHCENNWSVYQSAMCTSPACIASANVSIVRKLSMFVSVDKSTSMQSSGSGCPPPSTNRLAERWTPATNALKTFFQDPTSAGINVAFRFWSDKTASTNEGPCGDWPACPGPGGGACAVPQVAVGALTADAAPTDTQEQALLDLINATTPCGDTPIYPALDGATAWAINRKQAFPEEEVLVVFLTDGAPNVCNTNLAQITALAGDAYYNYGVRTYAMGFGNSNPTLIEQIAAAGGGTAFLLTAGAGLEAELVAAMQAVRGDTLSCDVTLPVQGVMNPDDVSVNYTDGMGMTTTLTKLTGPGDCGDGWYFDPANPDIVKLCPTTCAAIQAVPGGKVQAEVPCDVTYDPFVYSQTYEGSCPAGTKVQWGYLAYDAAAPGDSNVQIQVRTADTAAGLSAAMYSTAAVAQSTPTDTQVCPMAGPAPCPVDLFTALGGLPDARRDFLEVTMTLNPTSDQLQAPAVNTWSLTYSCPPSE